MRMFAGPNGSGKSSLKTLLPLEMQGAYLNPDDIERIMRERGFIDLANYNLGPIADEAVDFLNKSPFLREMGLCNIPEEITAVASRLDLGRISVNSYLASALTDFIRVKLLEAKKTITFETVMSHPGKVELLEKAQRLGYRTYLYYVATEHPLINISRVEDRVSLGGHSVPHRKIEERYYRSLDLLMNAISHSNRAYIFDNSGEDTGHTWIAEITEGVEMELKTDRIPVWFNRYVLGKLE